MSGEPVVLNNDMTIEDATRVNEMTELMAEHDKAVEEGDIERANAILDDIDAASARNIEYLKSEGKL